MTTPEQPRKRLRRGTAFKTAALLTAAIAATSTALAHPAGAATGSSVYAVAPYVDMSANTESLLDSAITGHGLKAYTAAFVIGTGCNQIWGDTLPIGNDSYTDPEIARAKSEGASVIISSGGAAGEPLAWTCSTQSSINSGYQALINDYGVTQLDFDVEGAAVADTAAAARQMSAMKTLKASNPNLRFSMTLAVLPSGLTGDGVNVLKAAKNAGIKIDVVNIMTMDYYQGSQDMGAAALSAARNTLAQMQGVDSSYTYANLGITPMIGVNDDGSQFTLANANSVEQFASQNGVGRLAFWSVGRDQACPGGNGGGAQATCSGISQSSLAFTSAFVPYTGTGGGTTGGTTTGGTTGGTTTGGTTGGTTTGGTTGGGTCAAAWNANTSYVPNDKVSYGGHNWLSLLLVDRCDPGLGHRLEHLEGPGRLLIGAPQYGSRACLVGPGSFLSAARRCRSHRRRAADSLSGWLRSRWVCMVGFHGARSRWWAFPDSADVSGRLVADAGRGAGPQPAGARGGKVWVRCGGWVRYRSGLGATAGHLVTAAAVLRLGAEGRPGTVLRLGTL